MKKIKIIAVLTLLIIESIFIFGMSNMSSNESNTKSQGAIVSVLKGINNIHNKFSFSKINLTDWEYKNASRVLNPFLRKVMHFTEYFVLTFLMISGLNLILDKKHLIILFISLIICFLFACFDEIHQLFIEGRNGCIRDVLIDTLGVVTCCLIYGTYYLIHKNKEV